MYCVAHCKLCSRIVIEARKCSILLFVFPMCRYQNQRHPSNKIATKQSTSSGEHLTHQDSSTNSSSMKREPLLPTPPSNQMVKLDTSLTCTTNFTKIAGN